MNQPKCLEISEKEIDALMQRIETKTLTDEDHRLIMEFLQALIWLENKVQSNELTIAKLRKLFGMVSSSEKAIHLNLKQEDIFESNEITSNPEIKKIKDKNDSGRQPKKRGAEQLAHVKKIAYPHPKLTIGQICPICEEGKLYRFGHGSVIKLTGNPPLELQIHLPEKLRCANCQELFTAPLPKEITQQGLGDASACATAAILKYEAALPFNRLSEMQKIMGNELSASQIWELCEEMGDAAFPIYKQLYKLAATGSCFHIDDTNVRILALLEENKENCKKTSKGKKKVPQERTGQYTTGILSIVGEQRIAIYLSGRKHAGENLADLLKNRPPDYPKPIQMSDALSCNTSEGIDSHVCYCLVHARRNFYDLKDIYIDEVRTIIELMSPVFACDAKAKKEELSEKQRLELHQAISGPYMEKLKEYCKSLLEDKRVEPNCALGKAIHYLLKHWVELTKFLSLEGAPLHNNDLERQLKKPVLQRKNSLFHKNLVGAAIGGVLCSLLETSKYAKINAYHYLKSIKKHEDDVKEHAQDWLPWNYQQTLQKLEEITSPD